MTTMCIKKKNRNTSIDSLFGLIWFYGVQQYFSHMVAVSFIIGGNRSTRKKTTDLSTLSHNFVSSTPRHERGSDS
jgi:hypothetical protein